MKISEVTIQDLKEYAHEESEDLEVIKAFTTILFGAKSFIKSYTGLTDEQMDNKEDLTITLFVLASEMYDNRHYSVDKDKVNVLVESILKMHCINLL